MPRLGVSKKKKSPRDTELSRLKRELQRVAAQLESPIVSKLQRARFSVSSLVLRPICNRCWTLSLRMLRGFVRPKMLLSFGSLVTSLTGSKIWFDAGATEGGRTHNAGTPIGRAILDRQTVHVHDLKAEIGMQFADSETIVDAAGTRTVLAIPLLREGNAIGAIAVRRTRCNLSPTSRSLSSRPSPIRP